MKIAFDSQIFTMQEYGGISRYICDLASQLAKTDGVEPEIFAPLYINAYLEKLPKKIVSGIKVPRIPKTGKAVQQGALWLARGAIERFQPDILHETYYGSHPAATTAARSVVTVYDMIHELFPVDFSKHDRSSELKRISTSRVDHVICISEATRNDLLALFGLPEEKVTVVYLGFNSLIPAKYFVESQRKPYLLYVGHRNGYKNFDGFLRAYASSQWLRNNFDVVCFGGGAFSSDEIKLIEKLELTSNQLMHVTGDDGKLACFYRDAALFVYPSLYEGFGIPPLEAMALDCPVACSNTSSIPEVVGDAAEYFDPNNTDSIRSAIESVLNSDVRRAELIGLGRLRYPTFTWARCASETLSVYNRLL